MAAEDYHDNFEYEIAQDYDQFNDENNADGANLRWNSRGVQGGIRLCEMDDSHLRNTVLMLMGFGYREWSGNDRERLLWITALRQEWDRRKKGTKSASARTLARSWERVR
jgi:hypothetical protein